MTAWRLPRSASALVAAGVVAAAGTVVVLPDARAADAGASAGGTVAAQAASVEQREIIVPMPGGELVRIDNSLGRVTIKGWDRPGQVHIVADKRAASPEALNRLRVHYTAWQNGEIHIDTRVELPGGERSLPLSGSGIDLVVEVPSEIPVEAKTFGGDLSASGLRGGAHLETTGGRIGVSDVRGGVVTRQLQGGQTVTAVDGDVDLDGVEGDMDLRGVGGGHLDARLVDGRIHAEDIRSALVRLTATSGDIVFVGLFQPAARYELRSYAGDVRVIAAAATAPFELRSRSAAPVETGLPLRTLWRQGDRARAVYVSRRLPGKTVPASALVEVSSVLGRVVIQPRVGDDRN